MYKYVDFSTYLREMTGLSIYDFAVLVHGQFTTEENEAELKEHLEDWLKYEPSDTLKEKAKNDLADYGYIEMGV